MRFVNPRDYATLVKINQELVNTVVDITVLIYKLHQGLTQVNSYSEAPKKTWYPGIEAACLIDRDDTTVNEEMQTVNVRQSIKFNFLRQDLQDLNIYPEMGDFIFFDDQFYEVHNTNEVQLWAGRPEYHHSIICEGHLTRITNLELVPTIK
jgi:hypothetical protein